MINETIKQDIKNSGTPHNAIGMAVGGRRRWIERCARGAGNIGIDIADVLRGRSVFAQKPTFSRTRKKG